MRQALGWSFWSLLSLAQQDILLAKTSPLCLQGQTTLGGVWEKWTSVESHHPFTFLNSSPQQSLCSVVIYTCIMAVSTVARDTMIVPNQWWRKTRTGTEPVLSNLSEHMPLRPRLQPLPTLLTSSYRRLFPPQNHSSKQLSTSPELSHSVLMFVCWVGWLLLLCFTFHFLFPVFHSFLYNFSGIDWGLGYRWSWELMLIHHLGRIWKSPIELYIYNKTLLLEWLQRVSVRKDG